MAHFNAGAFFRSMLDVGSDNRLMISYDSMSSDATTNAQGITSVGIMNTWDFPFLSNGEYPWVGYAGPGPGNTFSRLFMQSGLISANTPGGWTRSPTSNMRAPGGAALTTICGGPPSGGGTANVAPQPYCDFNILSAAARTAYLDTELFANLTTTGSAGIVAMILATLNTTAASTAVYPRGMRISGCPFSEKQCHARMLWQTNAAGPNDMRLRPVRQFHGLMTVDDKATALVGGAGAVTSSPTLTMNGANTVGYADVDCGAGPGIPGAWLCNPNGPIVGTAYSMYLTGQRVFRSSGGSPIKGTSICVLATGAHYDSLHASCLGIVNADMPGGDLIGAAGTNNTSPDPYFSAANAKEYIQRMAGGYSGAYPNKIIIYGGHNRDGTEQTELASGVSAKMVATLTAIMNKHTANAASLGSDAPDFLIVCAEKYALAGMSATVMANTVLSHRAAAVAYGTKCSFVDLHDLTNDDTGDYTIQMPWSASRATASLSGATGGPIAPVLNVHDSHGGNDYLWRLVWETGLRDLGIDPGTWTKRSGFMRLSGANNRFFRA